MAHPLYPVARRLVGRHVIAHHINGRSYPGILHSVYDHGIYLIHATPASSDKEASFITLSETPSGDTVDHVYAPASYFAFGALTGLTLGALARPYYGYGYGYPGYWW
ncbi:hypothetical protein C7445_101358 [Alicyclobacillus sacchari]|uniref:Uncharacterized protein n=1 Tax=Alicyclobacillus sacchari TaxID=392010 RepID=A0A4R8LXC9_9BACL|nr:hypothetical protein [Alicyclobacillus sacchari]TDY51356.1 hypothetical protein C7445_101358 [Alicyclobacillus sacchari]GMA56672.1 hypothetical protein GCM10025858_11750 [Alicyclobacillus sacchari]